MTGVSEATLISSFLPTTQDNFPKLNDKVPLCVKTFDGNYRTQFKSYRPIS